MNTKRWLFLCLGLAVSIMAVAVQGQSADFVFHRADGTKIVTESGDPVFYRGIAFGNRVWVNDRIPGTDHGEKDLARVHDMGMNLVRFYMNYRTLESDQRPYVYLDDGWQWLDNNISWARKHEIYLILNMHVPQGGYQSRGKAGTCGASRRRKTG